MTLTPEQAKFATRLFRSNGIPQSRIAKLFGVERTVIAQSLRGAKPGGHMDDAVNLTASQKKLVTILERHATRIIDEELREPLLSIREVMAKIHTRVDVALHSHLERLDEAIAKGEAEQKQHVGMMT